MTSRWNALAWILLGLSWVIGLVALARIVAEVVGA